MDETVGQRTYAPASQQFLLIPTAKNVEAAEITSREIDIAVRDLLDKGLERASEILRRRRNDLDAGADLLLKRETVTANDFPAIRSANAQSEPRVALVPAGTSAIESAS
jgi:cell division protease FtsH